jgi:hypothetical protein
MMGSCPHPDMETAPRSIAIEDCYCGGGLRTEEKVVAGVTVIDCVGCSATEYCETEETVNLEVDLGGLTEEQLQDPNDPAVIAFKEALAKELGVSPDDIDFGAGRRLSQVEHRNASRHLSYHDVPCTDRRLSQLEQKVKVDEWLTREKLTPGYRKLIHKWLADGLELHRSQECKQRQVPSRRLAGGFKIAIKVPKGKDASKLASDMDAAMEDSAAIMDEVAEKSGVKLSVEGFKPAKQVVNTVSFSCKATTVPILKTGQAGIECVCAMCRSLAPTGLCVLCEAGFFKIEGANTTCDRCIANAIPQGLRVGMIGILTRWIGR